MKAIVYDWIDSQGGAERLLPIVFDAYPKADIYTLFANYRTAPWALPYKHRIRTSWLQFFYNILPYKWILTPLMPLAALSLPLQPYNKVLTITSAFLKGVRTKAQAIHISYVFTPPRFLWHERDRYSALSTTPGVVGVGRVVRWLQQWDVQSAQKPTMLLTLSRFSASRIKRLYGRSARVVYPPFEGDYLEKSTPIPGLPPSYFLFVGRLEPYKRVELLVQTWNTYPVQDDLVVVGCGSQDHLLHRLARNNSHIHFYSQLPDAQLSFVYRHAKALLMPQREDFGYTALEALFCHLPVIAYKDSGVWEAIARKEPHQVIEKQTAAAIYEGLANFHTSSYNWIRAHEKRYAKKHFLQQLATVF